MVLSGEEYWGSGGTVKATMVTGGGTAVYVLREVNVKSGENG